MPFQHPANNFAATLATAHAVGDGQLALAAGSGAALGALGANEVYRLTVLANPGASNEAVLAIVEATGLSTDTLTGLSFVEGFADVALPAGSGVQVRATAKTFGAIQSALASLQSAVGALQAIAETQVTGATALLIGGSYVCSGTSAGYAVTLPTAVGVAGQVVHLRMSGALTKLVTVATTASQAIDGAATRVMCAGEAATLMSDGSNWAKVAGKTAPMAASMRLVANQTGSATQTSIAWNGTDLDTTGLMADPSGAHKVTIRRPGNYRVTLFLVAYGISGSGSISVQVTAGGKNAAYVSQLVPGAGSQSIAIDRLLALNAGDVIDAQVAGNVGFAVLGDPTSNSSYVDVSEVVSW